MRKPGDHWSDCATNNEPAYPAGPCDCMPSPAMCRAAVTYMNGADVYSKLPREVLEIEEGIYAEVWKAMQAAAPEAARSTQPAGWRDIETAPKDFVTEFDGWNGERVPNVSWAHPEYGAKGEYAWCVSEYETGHGWVNTRVEGLTHWMPIPQAPVAKEPT